MLFDKTFEILNLLNGEPRGSTKYIIPSEVGFKWTKETIRTFGIGLDYLYEKVVVDETNSSNQQRIAEEIDHWSGQIAKVIENQDLETLTDKLFCDMFYHSDRWCPGRIAADCFIFEKIKLIFQYP